MVFIDKTTLLPHPQFNKEVNLNDNESRSFFAVYDGHGGDVSAEYCHLHVHMNLVKYD
jgi:serine/threonine protein phosphatase PrpC